MKGKYELETGKSETALLPGAGSVGKRAMTSPWTQKQPPGVCISVTPLSTKLVHTGDLCWES